MSARVSDMGARHMQTLAEQFPLELPIFEKCRQTLNNRNETMRNSIAINYSWTSSMGLLYHQFKWLTSCVVVDRD